MVPLRESLRSKIRTVEKRPADLSAKIERKRKSFSVVPIFNIDCQLTDNPWADKNMISEGAGQQSLNIG